MLDFLKQFFTWWNGQTLGLRWYTARKGELVGEDEFGNKYYRAKSAVPDSIPEHATLESLGVRAQTGASVLVVERGSRSFPGPPADFVLEPGDRLLIFGSVDAVDRLHALLNEAR